MFNPAMFQPLQVFFDIDMGGLNKIYDKPNIPVGFEFTQRIGPSSTVEFNFFDEAGWEVEPYIWQARQNGTNIVGGRFQFGYLGEANVKSEWVDFYANNYVPVWTRNAFVINLFGDVALPCHLSSNQFSGTVKEVVDDFAKVYDLDVEYLPDFGTEHMMSVLETNHETTEEREMVIHKIQAESDWRTLLRALEHAMDQQGKPGYKPYLTTKNGKRVLKIIKARPDEAEYRYTVQAKDSVVLRWRPNVQLSPMIGGEEHVNALMSGTGYPIKLALDQESAQDRQESFGQDVYQIIRSMPPHDSPSKPVHWCPETMETNVTQGAIRSRAHGAINGFGGLNQHYSRFIQNWLGSMTAELTVMGDPTLEPGKNCEVLFYYPINYLNTGIRELHYTSGTYYVNEVVHSVDMSGYTTTLRMQRASLGATEPQKGNQE